MQRGFRQLLHSATPRTFAVTPILKLDFFLSLVILGAVYKDATLDATCHRTTVFFFLVAARKVVAAKDGWCALVNGRWCASAKLMYSTLVSLSPTPIGFGIGIGM
jgi:hypothetical protein